MILALWLNTIVSTILITLIMIAVIVKIREWVKASPRSLNPNFNARLHELIDRHQSDELISFATAELEHFPNYGYALFGLAIAHYQRGNYQQSYDLFMKLIELHPDYAVEYAPPYLEALRKKLSPNQALQVTG